jgi:hypothetical protein
VTGLEVRCGAGLVRPRSGRSGDFSEQAASEDTKHSTNNASRTAPITSGPVYCRANFYEKAHFVKGDVAAAVVESNSFCPSRYASIRSSDEPLSLVARCTG